MKIEDYIWHNQERLKKFIGFMHSIKVVTVVYAISALIGFGGPLFFSLVSFMLGYTIYGILAMFSAAIFFSLGMLIKSGQYKRDALIILVNDRCDRIEKKLNLKVEKL